MLLALSARVRIRFGLAGPGAWLQVDCCDYRGLEDGEIRSPTVRCGRLRAGRSGPLILHLYHLVPDMEKSCRIHGQVDSSGSSVDLLRLPCAMPCRSIRLQLRWFPQGTALCASEWGCSLYLVAECKMAGPLSFLLWARVLLTRSINHGTFTRFISIYLDLS